MKSMKHSLLTNINPHQAILALVFLLLFLPVAQAIHLSEHDNLNNEFNNEYNCLVCHGHANIDDGTPSSNTASFTSFAPVTDVNSNQGPFTTFTTTHPDTIRAPPSV